MTTKRLLEIISIMIEYNMLDAKRLNDYDYVKERIEIYLEAKHFVDNNFKGCF